MNISAHLKHNIFHSPKFVLISCVCVCVYVCVWLCVCVCLCVCICVYDLNVGLVWYRFSSVSARRCGTSGTVPAEAIGSVQEAEEQMLFETCEEGLYFTRLVQHDSLIFF